MSDLQPDLAALGVNLAIVGSGSPAQARDFQAGRKLRVPLYVDPGLKAFQAFGMKHGIGATVSPAAIGHAFRALASGHFQGIVQGDPWQQGGVLVVMPDGSIPYAYRSQEAGDHPASAEVLEAVRRATAE